MLFLFHKLQLTLKTGSRATGLKNATTEKKSKDLWELQGKKTSSLPIATTHPGFGKMASGASIIKLYGSVNYESKW